MIVLALALQILTCNEPAQFRADKGLQQLTNPPRLLLNGPAVVSRCDLTLEAEQIEAHVQGETLVRADVPTDPVITLGTQRLQAGWAVVDFERRLATLGGGVSVTGAGFDLTCTTLELGLEDRVARCFSVNASAISARMTPEE